MSKAWGNYYGLYSNLGMTNKDFSFIKIQSNIYINYCNQIVNIHSNAFKNFYLTSIGKSFLRQFYKSIINHQNGVVIGILYNNELIGFAAGTRSDKKFYSDIFKKNFISLSLSCLPIIFRNPFKIFSIVSHIFGASSSTDESDCASLLSICIDPSFSGKGIGNMLIDEFEKEIFKQAKCIILTTDFFDNDYVNQFYKNSGYILQKSFNKGKRKMNLYKKTI